ncbi:MAG: hypothetical protein K5839_01630 [Treponemataceae bacterium]|nr:hypothetical protein [Treponemataceae bacterium]
MKEIHFTTEQLFSNPQILAEEKIGELELSDDQFFSDKSKFLKFIQKLQDVNTVCNITFNLKPSFIDGQIVKAFSQIFCSLQFEFLPSFLAGEKKFFSKKMAMLNDAGLVFGFVIDASNFSSMKEFRLCLDEALSYYPNHIYVESDRLKATDKLSTQDIKNIRRLSFALETFYSAGRAVPWFNALLMSLRIKAWVFLSDFAEWQDCNNCGLNTDFDCEKAGHSEIEKMQLSFIKLKYEEKHLDYIFPACQDLVRLHGAFARADFEGESTSLELSYHPDDILSPYAMDLVSFVEEVCMEEYSVKVIPGENGPEII